jgi:hypothetical protein
MFCRGYAPSLIVFDQSGLEMPGDARVMNCLIGFANENINIEETLHLLACQAVVFWSVERKFKTTRLRYAPAWQPSLFALRSKSEGWRRGELNPCPRRYPRKHLHVYPVISFKEPNVAPAHCRLPSVREFPSPSGAVAPPFD